MLNRNQISKLSHSQYLALRAELEAKPSKHATPGAEVYQLDRIWHSSNPEVRRTERSEAIQREHDYRRSLPQKSYDQVKIETLKSQLDDWKRTGKSQQAIDGLTQQVAELQGAQAAEQAKAAYLKSEAFQNLKEWTQEYLDQADIATKHEIELRFEALKAHQSADRFNGEVAPFVLKIMEQRNREYLDAEQQNLRLQASAAKSAADSLERNRDRELEAVQPPMVPKLKTTAEHFDRYGKLLPSEGDAS